MDYNIFRKSVIKHLVEYKNSTLKVTENGVWTQNGKEYPHILPKRLENLNLLPMVKVPTGINLHKDCHHLNSSQMMCINFFEPLLNDDEGKDLLLKIIINEINVPLGSEARITRAIFEYVPCKKEGTNFDFFIEISSGEKLYFEIKYTEKSFGTIHTTKDNLSKYDKKWSNIYLKACI